MLMYVMYLIFLFSFILTSFAITDDFGCEYIVYNRGFSSVKNFLELILKIKLLLQWVPGHCGFRAEQGTSLQKPMPTNNSIQILRFFTSKLNCSRINRIYTLLASNFLQYLQSHAALKSWKKVNPSSIHDKPRRGSDAVFRLSMVHGYLIAHLHSTGISTNPMQLWRSHGKGPTAAVWGSLTYEILESKSASEEITLVFFHLYAFSIYLLTCHWK